MTKLNRASLSELALNLLRIMTGFTFTLHGLQKVFGVLGRESPADTFSWFWTAGVIETIGGPLVTVGLFTRPVAFLLSGEMAVAYLWRHLPRSFFPVMNGGEAAFLFCFIWFFISIHGGGRFSLDGWRSDDVSDATDLKASTHPLSR